MVGWKDILRPIRDGLRDQLPPRSPKEDDGEREKRRLQREHDFWKGFAYFDTFEQVEQWTPDAVELLQRANTPLMPRSQCAVDDNNPKAKVVLIHDYSGNYHDYEASQGSVVDKEGYACEYMQFVDTFVYFSHKLVCIPPPTWTNSLHRNGVKSLGTFLVEPQSTGIGKILERRSSCGTNDGWEYPIASQLVKMAEVYGFDGWLLNIEKTFPYSQWDRELMVGFVAQLRSQLGNGHGNVIWYDALTTSNMLQYQNSLTMKNLAFARAAGTLLTNYSWTPEKALAAKDLALLHGMDPKDVIFGIDVWAQDTQSKEHPRKTYGGGGTGTGIAVAELARLGLSAGVFAPAWPYEHFPNCSAAVQRSMWDGDGLPQDLNCHCVPADRHAITDYQINPIARFAQEYASGSKSFFYTNFESAFRGSGENGILASHVGSQFPLPHVSRIATTTGQGSRMEGEILCNPTRMAITTSGRPSHQSTAASLKLFTLDMTGSLEVAITYRKAETPENMHIAIAFAGTDERICIPSQACPRGRLSKILTATSRLSGIRVEVEHVSAAIDANLDCIDTIDILEICIHRRNMQRAQCSITDMCLKAHGRQHTKLVWSIKDDLYDSVATNDDVLPRSRITGPVSYFQIHIDSTLVGRAYATEYLLSEELAGKLDEAEEYAIQLNGIGFDGTLVCQSTCSSQNTRPSERYSESGRSSWQLV